MKSKHIRKLNYILRNILVQMLNKIIAQVQDFIEFMCII